MTFENKVESENAMNHDEIKDLLHNHKEGFLSLRRSYQIMLAALVIYTMLFGWSTKKNIEKTHALEDKIQQLEQKLNKQPTCCPPCNLDEPKAEAEAEPEPSPPAPAPTGSHRIIDGVDVDEPCIVNDSIYLLHLPCRRARILSSHLVIAGLTSVIPSPLSLKIAGDFGYFQDKYREFASNFNLTQLPDYRRVTIKAD